MQAILNRLNRVLLVSLSPLLVVSPTPAQADIFQWEYINPADPSRGKQQSTTLAPDGAGVDAVPGAYLGSRNLTMAYLIGADLTNAYADYANLTNADMSQANLANASFNYSKLTSADFTDAEVRGGSFAWYYDYGTDMYVGGISQAQLYSTASYHARDLSGIKLYYNNLAGWSFASQNLTNANFTSATLTDADFTGAEVHQASFSKD